MADINYRFQYQFADFYSDLPVALQPVLPICKHSCIVWSNITGYTIFRPGSIYFQAAQKYYQILYSAGCYHINQEQLTHNVRLPKCKFFG